MKRHRNFQIAKRIFDRIKCVPWTGSCNSDGYGSLRVSGRTVGAHRAVWTLFYGPIPDGMSVLHACDNRVCVNPLHLWLGTQTDNMRDAASKGRLVSKRGESHPRARWSWSQVREMRILYAAGQSQVRIAERFQTRQGSIDRILRGETWVDIPR